MREVVGLRGFRDEVCSGKHFRFVLDLGDKTVAFDTAQVCFCPNVVVLSNLQGDKFVIHSIDFVELERVEDQPYGLWHFICLPLGADSPTRYSVRSYQDKKFVVNY